MCGVTGFVRTGRLTDMSERVARELMRGIAVRGEHASGIAVVGEHTGYTCRRPMPSSAFVNTKMWEKAWGARPELLIGHARYATNGDPKVNENNHPHTSPSGRWVIVHNGVIRDNVNVETKTECDSEVIAVLLDAVGVEDTIAMMSEFKASSYAVLALDTKKKVLHAWRNSGSPLVMIDLTKTAGGYFFASTPEILRAALKRSLPTLKLKAKVWTLTAGWHYSFPLGCKGALEALEMQEAPAPVQSAPVQSAPAGSFQKEKVYSSWMEYYKDWPESARTKGWDEA